MFMSRTTRKRLAQSIPLFALTLAVAVGFSVASRRQAAAQGNDEAMVRTALQQNAEGFARNDLKMVSQVWADDESVTVFESGYANYGWADYRDHHLVPEMAEMKNTKYTLLDFKVKTSGNTAWATFKYTISADVKENGKDRHVDGAGLGTAVLEKRGDRWLIVHWHSSAPRRAPATATPKK
jgi:ketosteroid isomerase-like protein